MSEGRSTRQPAIVDRATFEARLEGLRAREKAHTREGDAIAAARRRLPMVEVAGDSPLLGPSGPMTLLDAFEGRTQLIAYYFMWWPGRPAAEQCEGNTAYGFGDAQTSYDESLAYRAFMGWDMPWYSAQPSLDALLGGAPDWPPLLEWPGGRPTAQWPRLASTPDQPAATTSA